MYLDSSGSNTVPWKYNNDDWSSNNNNQSDSSFVPLNTSSVVNTTINLTFDTGQKTDNSYKNNLKMNNMTLEASIRVYDNNNTTPISVSGKSSSGDDRDNYGGIELVEAPVLVTPPTTSKNNTSPRTTVKQIPFFFPDNLPMYTNGGGFRPITPTMPQIKNTTIYPNVTQPQTTVQTTTASTNLTTISTAQTTNISNVTQVAILASSAEDISEINATNTVPLTEGNYSFSGNGTTSPPDTLAAEAETGSDQSGTLDNNFVFNITDELMINNSSSGNFNDRNWSMVVSEIDYMESETGMFNGTIVSLNDTKEDYTTTTERITYRPTNSSKYLLY